MATRSPESRYLVKLAWAEMGIVWLLAFIATWFRGLRPEIIIGWIAMITPCDVNLQPARAINRARSDQSGKLRAVLRHSLGLFSQILTIPLGRYRADARHSCDPPKTSALAEIQTGNRSKRAAGC